jgi:hypothetical protein
MLKELSKLEQWKSMFHFLLFGKNFAERSRIQLSTSFDSFAIRYFFILLIIRARLDNTDPHAGESGSHAFSGEVRTSYKPRKSAFA